MFTIDTRQIERARGMIGPGRLGERHALVLAFESWGNEVGIRAMALRSATSIPSNLAAYREMARLARYASYRLTELLARLGLLGWMQRQFQVATGEDAASWHMFAALTIKDFHVDIGSLMDAVAPVILQAGGAYDATGETKLPGFADVQKQGSQRSVGFRGALPAGLRDVVDSTDRWWPPVKRLRDNLAHREHDKIVFGNAETGVLFQVYTGRSKANILDTALLWKPGHNVADFWLYAVAVVSELFVFLEELGISLANTVGMSATTLTASYRVGDLSYLLEPMERLINTKSDGPV